MMYRTTSIRFRDIKASTTFRKPARVLIIAHLLHFIHKAATLHNTALLRVNTLSNLHNSLTMKNSFKVLICGGGVSGLSLALMLEKLEIDYLVFEAYPEVTANVGAAVVLLPNGLRILDQLGVYDSFKEQYDEAPVTDAKFFSPEGRVLGTLEIHELARWYV